MAEATGTDETGGVGNKIREQVLEGLRMAKRKSKFLEGPRYDECRTENQRRLWGEAQAFADEIGGKIHDSMKWYLEGPSRRESLDDKTIKDLEGQGKLDPQMKLQFGKRGEDMIKNAGLGYKLQGGHLNPDEAVFLFRLPEPLAEAWLSKDRTGRVRPGVLGRSWGVVYEEVVKKFWEVQRRFDEKGLLKFERVNDVGEHDPNPSGFYYVWIAGMPHRERKES